MKTATTICRLIHRMRSVWGELDYAQRRLFEIRTGIEVDEVQRQRRARRTVSELEALYSAGDPWLADERWLGGELRRTG